MLESPSSRNIRADMTRAQEAHARLHGDTAVLYRLYTEDHANLLTLVRRYFGGATLLSAIGIWSEGSELSKVIEIVGNRSQLQRVFDLAGDIRVTNSQTCVLVTWQPVYAFEVTEDAINASEAAF